MSTWSNCAPCPECGYLHGNKTHVCRPAIFRPPTTAAPFIPLGQKRHDLQALVNDIKTVLHQRDGRISVTEAIGALEIAKMEIFKEQIDD